VAGVIVEFSKVPEATFASILTDIYRVSGIEKPSGVVTPASTNGPPIVTTKKAYWITKEYLPPEFYELWSGVDGGTLAVPYKLQFKDGRLTGGGTLGGYLGYRQKWLRVPSTFMGSIGLAAVPTAGPTLTTGQGTVDTKIAVSAAAGAVFEIYSQIQAGIVVGTDYTGTADYAYDKRLWISLAIGAGFLKR
jgi:hypothetical protein